MVNIQCYMDGMFNVHWRIARINSLRIKVCCEDQLEFLRLTSVTWTFLDEPETLRSLGLYCSGSTWLKPVSTPPSIKLLRKRSIIIIIIYCHLHHSVIRDNYCNTVQRAKNVPFSA